MTSLVPDGFGAMERSASAAIVIRAGDAERLHGLAVQAMLRAPRAAGALLDGLRRARIRPDLEVPDEVIGLGSVALIAESVRGGSRNRRLQLVDDPPADPPGARVSVLTPLGAALLGLSPGEWVRFADRQGGIEHIVVLEASRAHDAAPT